MLDGDDDKNDGVSEVEENAHEESDQENVDGLKQEDKGDKGLDNNKCGPKFKRSYRTDRSKLSDKVENFQVRVKVLEGRQLAGSNIKAVVKVKCGPNLTKITRVRKGSSPVWGETMIFNFKESLQNLYDLVLEFRVNNSKRQIKSPSECKENNSKQRTISRSDSLIGHFKLDLGNLYDQKEHAYVRKWILLTDPEDPSNASKGYLKTTMCILGAGDQPPNEHGKEDDDVEGNVLTPAGAALRSFNFVLRVYKAEDIPQMDGTNPINILNKSKTGLADPYLMFRFAGKRKKTKVIEHSRNPEWNEELSLALKFPSMCNALQLAVFDKDTFKDDPVGTIKIPVSRISSAGDEAVPGFLPTFGPTFVNMYGSKREYSDCLDPLEPMNHGEFEGCAYRGRVMVELETRLDEENGGKMECCTRIDDDIIESSKKYLRRRKHELVVTFESASMIEKTDGYIEFEVSIGNFGNKFDSEMQATSSTTEPIRAISDGTYYYYLPWGQNKPIVWVPSHWEDSGFRYYALNVLLRMTTKMESDVEQVIKMITEDYDKIEVANKIVEIFDDLISFCKKNLSRSSPLPDPRGRTAANSLDARLYRLRMQHVESILDEATLQRKQCPKEEVTNAVRHLEEYLERLKDITYEPQSSIPDVFIWMLSGNKRIAYARIPANEVLLCKDNKERSGRMYGEMQTIFLKYPTVKRKSKKNFKIACKLQAKIWLMRFVDHADFNADFESQGKISVWAETYEMQRKNVTGKSWEEWGFKDFSGEITLPKEKFKCPSGWKWAEDWSPSNLSCNVSSGFGVFTEEAWDIEDRLDYWGTWQRKGFLNGKQEGLRNLDDIECLEGWQWQDKEWKRDYSRACDEEGWMYKNDDTTWDSSEKVFHLIRKRRLVRTRKCTAESLTKKESGGWEYIKTRHRRKLWMRRLVAEDTKGAAAIFTLDRPLVHFAAVPDGDTSTSMEEPPPTPTDPTAEIGQIAHFEVPTAEPMKEPGKTKKQKNEKRKNADTSDAKSKKGKADKTSTKKQKEVEERTSGISDTTKAKNKKKILRLPTPRIYMKFENAIKLQLRVYIYQARSLYPMDQGNFSDPFVIANFMNACKRTELCHHTLNPIWDQSLIMELDYFGDLSNLETSCPDVILEIFDEDDIVPVGKSAVEFKRGRIKKSSIEFMGRSVLKPFYKPDSEVKDLPSLAWHDVMRGNVQAGSVLATAELILKTKDKKTPPLPPGKTDMPFMPSGKTGMYEIPKGIRPELQRTALEFLVWGVRNMKPYKLLSVERPSVVIEMGKVEVRSEVKKKYRRCPNFSENVFYFGKEYLPKEQIYRPPIVIRVKDHRKFGRRPTVGQHILSLDMLPSPPKEEDKDAVIDITPGTPTKDSKTETEEDKEHVEIWMYDDPAAPLVSESDSFEEEEEEEENEHSGKTIMDTFGKFRRPASQIFTSELRKEEIDWWSKYYASKGECEQYKSTGMDTIKVYKNELEKEKPYNNFSDFLKTFYLYRGKQEKDDDDPPRVVGELKGAIFMYSLPEDHTAPMPGKILRNIPSSEPVEVTVRVYVIRAFDLAPQDPNGLADPYLKIKAGKKKKVDRSNYLPNTLNPVFGRMFELDLVLPMEKDLRIEVFDWDLIGTDDKVGETVIDLENRYYSKYKAWCGLPKSYCIQGINKWRDQMTPKEWLDEKAKEMAIDEPVWNGNTCVLFDRKKYPLERFEKENWITRYKNEDLGPPDQRLALHVLKTLPHVPEHVETRPLYIDTLPGIEQGRLELWVDMFPKKDSGKPVAAVDISPRQPAEYFLRVIIWNCEEIPMMDTSVFGEQMTDIYVKGWMEGKEHKTQKTDVHHRSLDGSGMFNWRFIFPFDYLRQERVVVVKRKDHLFSLDETTAKFPPILHIQVWDEDTFGPNEYISELEVPIINAPKPSKFSRFATLKNIPDIQGNCEVPHVNMFVYKRMRGWWPLYAVKDGKKRHAGKIEMTIELATKEEHEEKPAGKARNEPNENPKLEKPMRPATSFAWFTSPWKSFRYVIWRKYGCMVITIVLILLLLIFVLLFLYTLPGSVTRYMVIGH